MSLSKHCLPYNLSYWDWESSSKSLGMPVIQRVILLEATIVTYLLILQDQRVEWEQQQKGRPTSTWCVPMCAAWVEILCITQIPGEYRINFISLLILLILLVSGNTYLKKCQALCLRRRYVAVAEKLASPCHNVLFHVHFIYYAEHSYSAYYCSHSN